MIQGYSTAAVSRAPQDMPLSPTREGSLEFEMNQCRDRVSCLGDSLMELRSRIGRVLRDIPKADQSGVCSHPPGPKSCPVSDDLRGLRAQIEKLHEGVREMIELVDIC